MLDILLPPGRDDSNASTRQILRKKLREGELNDREVEVEVSGQGASVDILTPPGMEEMTQQLQGLFSNMKAGSKARKMPVQDALKVLKEDEAAKLIDHDALKVQALEAAEQNGIIFIDEIDKVAKRGESGGADVSREGVQRDLLPLIEGCSVTTKHGTIKTDHILFIASGAFHLSKPSDLIPELQGRLPIRVELDALTPEDFRRILTEPKAALTAQYQALLATEGVTVTFTEEGIERLAERLLGKLMNTARISAPDDCIRLCSDSSKRFRSQQQMRGSMAQMSLSIAPSLTGAWAIWRKMKIYRGSFCNRVSTDNDCNHPHLLRPQQTNA